jgi:hypothetical protein
MLGVGLTQRLRRPRLHRTLMLVSFATDLVLVVYIEVTRHAVERVASRVQPLLWVHAGISLAVLACYVVMIGAGRGLLAGRGGARSVHRRVGAAFCVLRSLNYVTSFLL